MKNLFKALDSMLVLKVLLIVILIFDENLVQIRPFVTQHPTKSFSNQRSYTEYHVFFYCFAIFYINYFMITCSMPF